MANPPVPFQQIPGSLRTPFFFAEVSNTNANTSQQRQRALIIGQAITGQGQNNSNLPQISNGSVGAGAVAGGKGSMLDLMNRAYRANDSFGEMWFLPLADAGGAVAATGTITFTGPSTAAGAIYLYLGALTLSNLITVPLISGSTATQAATAVAAAINAAANCPVSATAAAGVVTVTGLNLGAAANDIPIVLNYLGIRGGQAVPAGMTAVIVAMSGGVTNPTLTTALANLQDKAFDFIVSPYTDATSVAAITAFLNDITGRWSWETQIYGHCFIAYRGTFGGQSTFGTAMNDQHTTCIGFLGSPSPNYAWAAALAGGCAVSARADAAQPLHTVPINGVLAPPLGNRFSLSQRNTLLFDGISTFTVDDADQIRIELAITTYQLNTFGQADDSYLKVETLTTLTAILRTLADAVTSKFARCKLADNGVPIRAGSNIVTPNTVAGFLVAQYQTLEEQGLVQDSASFAANLVVQRNATNPNRLDVLWPPVLINQLDVFALLAQFRLVPSNDNAAPASQALA